MWSKLALVAALAATASPALAINWTYIGKNTYGSVYEVDSDSVTRAGSVVTFHLRVRYGPDGPKGEADGYVATRRANCADRSYSDLTTDYMKDGKVLRTSGAEETRTATAQSIAGEVLKRVCGS
jgi:Surface-adhesin protein E